ncbi:hypothetical protein MBM_02184 [Drepanopeziza brunnea f. sp. 'multigermtubi' MB_m1]|uniref:DDE-1 domain-containing protein n=1 Tax=Marssonina brunnea f. sp. multigermtubi (strain MB_m1) TaxID=1072389 RepID=K1X574_MARBU|nr:uncharacterized protein MBM_02184 [Drepanopeziza brunnea f. sp. 'multigermtubi' MB_m1]EKD20232.1 hypothetical protein MBM_02184 [Drepanopeziza brunnea f. sp. 'multigermtubi' MB_m1]
MRVLRAIYVGVAKRLVVHTEVSPTHDGESQGRTESPARSSQHKRIQLAFEWLLENPSETPLTASRIHMIEKPDTLKRRWNRYQAKQARLKEGKALQVERLMVLSAAQHKAVLIYAANQATKGGKGATKRMLYRCICYLKIQENKPKPSWRWFQSWLRNTAELYAIRTKPIASYRVDMHIEKSLSNWFYTELVPAIQFCGIGPKDKHRIANIDKKGARICMPAGEEVIVPIGIKEIYTRIYENRLSVTVIEAILADRKAIPLMIIFSEKMTRHEVVTVSESGYTNDRITIEWLKHFIKHTDQGPDKPWMILLLDSQLCYEALNFILLAKQNRFEAEYIISSFMRDFLQIREQTFTTRNIKHAFRDVRMWPISFSQIQRKLKEYSKKSKKEAGLHILEYGETSDLEEDEYSFSIDKQPDELPLLALPRPP